MENLALWYIIRASFSHERMTYIPEDSKVVYWSKDGKEEKFLMRLNGLADRRDVNTCGHVFSCPEQGGIPL